MRGSSGHRPHSLGPGSCRGCAVTCERLVHPADCLRRECPQLVTEEARGRSWIGCGLGVFGARIDLERFQALQRTAAGFGSLRVQREPLPICAATVQRTFPERGGPCVNPDFLLADSAGGYEIEVHPAAGGRR